MKKTISLLVVFLTIATTMLSTSAAIVPAESTSISASVQNTRNSNVYSITHSQIEVSRVKNIITVIRNNTIIAQWNLCNDTLYTSSGTVVCTVPSGTTTDNIYVGQNLNIYIMQTDGLWEYQSSGWSNKSKYNYEVVRYNLNSKGYLTSVAFSFGTMPVEKLFTT